MRLSRVVPVRSAVFDEPNLVSHAGWVPAMGLASRAGLIELAGRRVTMSGGPGHAAGLKVSALVGATRPGRGQVPDRAGAAAPRDHRSEVRRHRGHGPIDLRLRQAGRRVRLLGREGFQCFPGHRVDTSFGAGDRRDPAPERISEFRQGCGPLSPTPWPPPGRAGSPGCVLRADSAGLAASRGVTAHPARCRPWRPTAAGTRSSSRSSPTSRTGRSRMPLIILSRPREGRSDLHRCVVDMSLMTPRRVVSSMV
jgi:hypothetical protein